MARPTNTDVWVPEAPRAWQSRRVIYTPCIWNGAEEGLLVLIGFGRLACVLEFSFAL